MTRTLATIAEFLTFAAIGLVAALAVPVHAAETVDCALTTSTGGAVSTTGGCTSGTVTWQKGDYLLMQCTTDVYVSSTTTTNGGTVTAATTGAEFYDFTNNKDKVGIPLDQNDRHVSVLAATANGSCKFMKTKRKKPSASQ